MDATRIGLFALAEQRLAWTDQRQAVLAQNIANAATPGFQPRDVAPFAKSLAQVAAIAPVRTQPNHLPGAAGNALLAGTVAAPGPHGPDGNSVELDAQLSKVADTETAQSLTMSIYRKYLAMFGEALGRATS